MVDNHVRVLDIPCVFSFHGLCVHFSKATKNWYVLFKQMNASSWIWLVVMNFVFGGNFAVCLELFQKLVFGDFDFDILAYREMKHR